MEAADLKPNYSIASLSLLETAEKDGVTYLRNRSLSQEQEEELALIFRAFGLEVLRSTEQVELLPGL
jgi:hypothetical protein